MNVVLLSLIFSQTLNVQTPAPIAIQLVTPAPGSMRLSRQQILDRLMADLRKETDLDPKVLDESAFAGCEGAMACFAARTRDRVPARLLLVVSVIGEKAADWAAVLLLDIDRTLECQLDDTDAVDLCANRRAVAEVPRTMIHDRAELEAFLTRAVTEDLRGVFESSGNWRVTSSIDLVLESSGFISIDGRELGPAERGTVRLLAVPIGRHKIGARYSTGETAEEVEVRHGDAARLHLIAPSAPRPLLRTALLWSGVVTAAAGTVFTIWAIAFTASRGTEVRCSRPLDDPDGSCGSRFVTIEQMIGSSDAMDTSGVLALPLGYSLLGAGAAWGLGAWFFDSEIPWIEALIGIAVGGAAYGFTALIDEKT